MFGIVIYAMPVFFLGFLAQLVFGSYLGWLPTSDQASPITQAFLPVHTHILFVDAIWAKRLGRALGHHQAPDPARRRRSGS